MTTAIQHKPNNPRQISQKELDRLAVDLTEYGDLGGVIHNTRTGNIVGGNQRSRVFDLLNEGAEIIITLEHDEPTRTGETARGYILWQGERYDYRRVDWSESKEDAACLTANLRGGSWDWSILESWSKELVEDVGFDDELSADWNTDAHNLSLMLEAQAAEIASPEDAGPQVDRAEELREAWGVELGQVWEIPSKTADGVHRLVCGDCTDRATVDACLQDDKPLLMVTDPPYGVEYDPAWRESLEHQRAGTSSGDKIAGDNNFDWLRTFSIYCPDLIYVWCASWFIPVVQMYFEQLGYSLKYLIVWNKDLQVIGRGCYHWKHEPLLFMSKSDAPLSWGGSRDQTTVWDIPTIHSFKNGHNADEWGLLGHSTQKPLECMERPIRNHDAAVVYDPFIGSGTTLVACERQGRLGRGIEISPAYVAVTLQRLADLGLEPQRV